MLRFNHLLVATVLTTTVLLSACGKDEGEGKVVATVNGTNIRDGQITSQMAQLPAQLVQGREAEIRRQLTERLVEQTLIEQGVHGHKSN